MLKRIAVADLQVGMFVHEFCGSRRHALWSRRFLLGDELALRRVRESGVLAVWIDTAQGSDTPAAPAAPPPLSALAIEVEARQAQQVCLSARAAVSEMLASVRLGQAVDVGRFEPLFDEIRDSVERHPHALIGLARQLDLGEAQVRAAGMAGLLHDLGKAAIPEAILNKPGRLSDAEFAIVRGHPEAGHRILCRDGRIDAAVLDACLHHHEKLDGSGYPHGLAGERIGLLARMCAICDVYDAVTSERVYKHAWDPAEALHRMATWQGHFDDGLFQAFVKAIGIYPVGSLVRLSDGRLALVVEQHPGSLLTPRVRVLAANGAETLLDLGDAATGLRIVRRDPAAGARLSDLRDSLAALYAEP